MILKPLQQHNRERSEFYDRLHKLPGRGNGLACPDCGKELVDVDPFKALTTNPPRMHVACACGFKGTRIT